jgi:hypothetical protein
MLDKYINSYTLAMCRTLTYYGRIKNCFFIYMHIVNNRLYLYFTAGQYLLK